MRWTPKSKQRPRWARIVCVQCHVEKGPSAFARGSSRCRTCGKAPDHGEHGVTIRLGGRRVLRLCQLEDLLVLTQGYRLAGTVQNAVSPVRHVHIPLRALKAVKAALERFATP